MKIRNTILLLSLLGGAIAQAADWKNPSGGLYGDASNWNTNVVPDANGEHVNINGNLTVTDGFTGERMFIDKQLNVTNGATLNRTAGQASFLGATITVNNGAKISFNETKWNQNFSARNNTINCFVKNGIYLGEIYQTSTSNPIYLNLGLEGSISGFRIRTVGDMTFNMSFSLNNASASGPDAIYSIQTRTLVDMGSTLGANPAFGALTVTGIDGLAMTKVATEAELTLDSSSLGKYYTYRDDSKGGDLMVKYVTASVPEPSTAMLGLIGLVALALHRRRK